LNAARRHHDERNAKERKRGPNSEGLCGERSTLAAGKLGWYIQCRRFNLGLLPTWIALPPAIASANGSRRELSGRVALVGLEAVLTRADIPTCTNRETATRSRADGTYLSADRRSRQRLRDGRGLTTCPSICHAFHIALQNEHLARGSNLRHHQRSKSYAAGFCTYERYVRL